MASAQVEEFTKSSEEPTIGSPTIEEPAKSPTPATQNVESPYDEDDEEVTLPEESEKLGQLDDEQNQKALSPQIIDDDDDDDEDENENENENAEDEEPELNSTFRSNDFSEEDGDEDD